MCPSASKADCTTENTAKAEGRLMVKRPAQSTVQSTALQYPTYSVYVPCVVAAWFHPRANKNERLAQVLARFSRARILLSRARIL
eukprot:4819526-Pleurochrysis_carterae.AAC.1